MHSSYPALSEAQLCGARAKHVPPYTSFSPYPPSPLPPPTLRYLLYFIFPPKEPKGLSRSVAATFFRNKIYIYVLYIYILYIKNYSYIYL